MTVEDFLIGILFVLVAAQYGAHVMLGARVDRLQEEITGEPPIGTAYGRDGPD